MGRDCGRHYGHASGVGDDTHVYWPIGTQDGNKFITWGNRYTREGWRSRSGISLCHAGNGVQRHQGFYEVGVCAFVA